MKKKIIILLIVLALIMLVAFLVSSYADIKKKDVVVESDIKGTNDVSNMAYIVDGEEFVLVNGVAEKSSPEFSTTNSLSIFGEPVYEDFDSDGDKDSALWLLNDPGGTGKFHYAVLAINNEGLYVPTNAMFLGDRIAPQGIDFLDGRFVYNFAERGPDEPMTAEPTIGRSVWMHYDKNTNSIGEWVKDFEGEANPSTMKLDMKTWDWQYSEYGDGSKVYPKNQGLFSVTFEPNGSFYAGTDCNSLGGDYMVDGSKITFGEMRTTLMYCEGSQEAEFQKMLKDTNSYFFTSKGELVLNLKYDSGTAVFK